MSLILSSESLLRATAKLGTALVCPEHVRQLGGIRKPLAFLQSALFTRQSSTGVMVLLHVAKLLHRGIDLVVRK